MDKDTLLKVLKEAESPEHAIFRYCVTCGKDPGISNIFVRFLQVGERVQEALGIICGLYSINILRDSQGNIIQYL